MEFKDSLYQRQTKAEAALAPFEKLHGIRRQVRARQVQMLGSSGTVTTLAGVNLALPRYVRARLGLRGPAVRSVFSSTVIPLSKRSRSETFTTA